MNTVGEMPENVRAALLPAVQSTGRAFESYFTLDCAECVLRSYPNHSETYQVLSNLVDYSYIESRAGAEDILTKWIASFLPGYNWFLGDSDYGITQEEAAHADGGRVVTTSTTATPTSSYAGPRYYLRMPWSHVDKAVSDMWHRAACTALAPQPDSLFTASSMKPPAHELAIGREWLPLNIFTLPVDYNLRLVIHQHDLEARAAPCPMRTSDDNDNNDNNDNNNNNNNNTSTKFFSWLTLLPAYAAVPMASPIMRYASSTACNVTHTPYRLVFWRHGSWTPQSVIPGNTPLECSPGEIYITGSCELAGVDQYETWVRSRCRSQYDQIRILVGSMALSAACHGILMLPDQERVAST